MADVQELKIGGQKVICKMENRLSNYENKVGEPLMMSAVRTSWNMQLIQIPSKAMEATLKLIVGSDVHREITLSVNVPISIVNNSENMFNTFEKLVEWSMDEAKANRFIAVGVDFFDKNGNRI